MTPAADHFPRLDQVLTYLALAAALPFAAWFLFERFAALMAKIITRFTGRSDPVVATVRGGSEGMVGEVGVVRKPLAPRGKVFVRGELWDAVEDPAEGAGAGIAVGSRVRVEAVDGLTLRVVPHGTPATTASPPLETDRPVSRSTGSTGSDAPHTETSFATDRFFHAVIARRIATCPR